jgi:hypothetical protein
MGDIAEIAKDLRDLNIIPFLGQIKAMIGELKAVSSGFDRLQIIAKYAVLLDSP